MAISSEGGAAPRKSLVLLIQVVIAAIPVLLFVYFNIVKPLPWFALRRYDPEMAYLLNSLAILKSRPYMYYHHPGTPLMVLGSVIMLAMRAVSQLSSDEFITVVLSDPSRFLRVAYGLPTIVSSFVMAGLFRRVEARKSWVHTSAAAAVALSLLAAIPVESLKVMSSWNQNYFSLPLGTGILLLLWIRLRHGAHDRLLELTAFGVAAGVLWSMQFYLLAWAVGVAIIAGLARGLARGRLSSGLEGFSAASIGVVLGFAASFLPLLHRMREYVWWMRGLIAPNTSGLPAAGEIAGALARLFEGHWFLAGVLIVAIGLMVPVVLASRSRSIDPAWWAVSAGTLAILAVLVGIVLVAALSGRARSTYLLPVASIVPILLALTVGKLLSMGQPWRNVVVVVSAALFGSLLIGSFKALEAHSREVHAFNEGQAAIDRAIERAADDQAVGPANLTVLWTHGSPSACYGLRFGDIYTEGAFEQEVDQLCPREWAYFPWSDQVSSSEGIRAFSGTEGWDLLVGPAHMPAGADGLGKVESMNDLGLIFVFRE